MTGVLLLLTLCNCLLLQSVAGIPLSDFYPFGVVAGDLELPPNDDGSTAPIALSIVLPFFASTHDTLFVSEN